MDTCGSPPLPGTLSCVKSSSSPAKLYDISNNQVSFGQINFSFGTFVGHGCTVPRQFQDCVLKLFPTVAIYSSTVPEGLSLSLLLLTHSTVRPVGFLVRRPTQRLATGNATQRATRQHEGFIGVLGAAGILPGSCACAGEQNIQFVIRYSASPTSLLTLPSLTVAAGLPRHQCLRARCQRTA